MQEVFTGGPPDHLMPVKRRACGIDQSCAMGIRTFIASLASAAILAGCAAALPHGTSDTPSPFDSFAQAEGAAARIVPLSTSPAELRAMGFDTEAGKNVTLVPYPDVLARLVP